jgi:hypothetical protein
MIKKLGYQEALSALLRGIGNIEATSANEATTDAIEAYDHEVGKCLRALLRHVPEAAIVRAGARVLRAHAKAYPKRDLP